MLVKKKTWTKERREYHRVYSEVSSRVGYKYETIAQLPAHTLDTINRMFSGGWARRHSVNGPIDFGQIRGAYPDVSPKVIEAIYRTFHAGKDYLDNDMPIDSPDSVGVKKEIIKKVINT